MYSMSNLVFALIIGGGIGGVVGWYLALNARGDNKRKMIMDLESQLDQAKQDRADYEAEVSEQTAHVALERGIAFIGAGHHATERYGVQAVGSLAAEALGLSHEFIDIDNPA